MDSGSGEGLEDGQLRALRIESLSALAGGITHDLTNTFASINMALELLGAKAQESDRWMISSLDASVRRGMEAVRQILFLASAKEQEPLVYQAVHLVRDVQKLLREDLPATVTLTSEHPDEVCLVRGEPLVLYQLLLALAFQARSELALGGSLILRTTGTMLDDIDAAQRPLARPGLHLRVDVESRAAESLETVPRPREDPAEPPQALLAALAREGGFFEVRHVDARTTAASIFLPAIPGSQAAPEPVGDDRDHRDHRGKGETIVVIEPHATLRGALAAVLEGHGYRAFAAEDAAGGVARLAQAAEPVAAVLFAARSVLREGSGLLRAVGLIRPEIPVLVTGDGLALAAISHPGAPVSPLESPFTAAELFRALAAGLAQAQGARS